MTEIKAISDNIRSIKYWSVTSLFMLTHLFLLSIIIGSHTDSFFTLAKSYIPFLVLFMITLVPKNWGDCIAHFKLKNPLPGCQAFSKWIKDDSRISSEKVKNAVGGTFPRNPVEQNKAWYQLYQKVKHQPEAIMAQRKYILFRDLAILQVLAIIAWSTFLFSHHIFSILDLILLFGAYFAFVIAAQNSGVRFVKTVLAIS